MTTSLCSCDLGYFVNGDMTLPTGQSLLCLGQLGDWFHKQAIDEKIKNCTAFPSEYFIYF